MNNVLLRLAMLLLALTTLFSANGQNIEINTENIDIVRDKWGVPHVYGKTDEEAAYGMGWVICEDDFATLQQLILATRGRLAEVSGKDGAILDFMAHIMGVDRMVDENYRDSFSPKYNAIIDAYTLALNDYAEAHPKEILRKNLFPVTGLDYIRGYTLTMGMLTNVYVDIIKIFSGQITEYEKVNIAKGSNAFAFNSTKTKDGKTYLAVNSHQPLEGLFSWYEVHLNSEEGLNFLGGTFAGGIHGFLGTNEHLGWAATLNHPDLSDVYKLTMHPTKKNYYKFDGEWLKLEERPKRVKVKVGPIRIPIKKKFYWSKYGSTLKTKDGYYSLRFPSGMDLGAPEQLYKMNKAKSFEEFLDVMSEHHFAGVNIIYADRADNIYFISNGHFPYRNPNYDWTQVVPGDTSATLWEAGKFHPFKDLPHYINPSCGWLYNTNSPVFTGTCVSNQINPDDYPQTWEYTQLENNRSLRAQELIEQYEGHKISYEDFKNIKYDMSYSDSLYTYAAENIRMMFELDPEKYPKIADALQVINDWDLKGNIDNTEAALCFRVLYYIIDLISAKGTMYEANSFPEEVYVEAISESRKHLLKHFGTLRVPLGEFHRHVRGDVNLPIGSGPEVIASNFSVPWKKGRYRTYVGESYIQMLQYSEEGVEIETINAYGTSNKPDSPHYTDQMQMFVDRKLKKMTLNKKSIYDNATSIYHPGGNDLLKSDLKKSALND